ncbi:Uncharacterized protein MLTONO_p0077 (plasmid) [Mesorhizobium loti]|nr:Uncharacterized protein MLTONO_p0077 [Mesorhizobium loti]BCH05098.1 hypothetical protein MesoLj131b_70970 [Mesorhizobium sp. 131-2-5]
MRVAMVRLLEGCPIQTNGRLIITNFAHEAGVSRATANRAPEILTGHREAIAAERARGRALEGEPEGPGEERKFARALLEFVAPAASCAAAFVLAIAASPVPLPV